MVGLGYYVYGRFLLHLWLLIIAFMVGITFMVFITFMGNTATITAN